MNKDIYELSYSMRKELHQKIFFFFALILSVFFALNLILNYLIFPVRQNSVSMTPDIEKGNSVLFSPLDRSFSRGDVVLLNERSAVSKNFGQIILDSVVCFFTARQYIPSKSGDLMGNSGQIRRIIGVPGDEIYMRDYVMYIKPAGEKYFLTEFELINKNYDVSITAAPASWDSSLGVSGSFDVIKLEDHQYFVLGDMRNSSVDSRMWGPVTSKEIKATAILQYLPVTKFRVF